MHLVTVTKQCPSASLQCNRHRGPGRDSAGTFYGEIRASMEDRQLRSAALPLNVIPPEPTIHCTLPCSQRGQRGCLQSSGRSSSGPAYGGACSSGLPEPTHLCWEAQRGGGEGTGPSPICCGLSGPGAPASVSTGLPAIQKDPCAVNQIALN